MSANGRDADSRPVLVPAGNKTSLTPTKLKPGKKPEKKDDKLDSSPKTPALTARTVLKRKETLLYSNLSLNASCSSDCSTESFRSRASTGRIRGRGSLSGRRRQGVPRPERSVERVLVDGAVDGFGKKRCAWVTPNTDPSYATFHDEEWGVPVHDDKKLFELLVLSGALAELTWPLILSKREMFREVFLDFDPVPVSKLNEKKFVAQGSTASSLLSEPKLRAAIENARQILKIVEEFGSLDKYFWNFVNHKPIINQFRYSRQVPVKTPKADFISKDMVRRGFRSVGPTVIYSFMQASGMTNDHLISCYRFEECCVAVSSGFSKKEESNQANGKMEDDSSLGTSDTTITTEQEHRNIDLELARAVEDLSIS